jgi:hypothetical protein
VIATGKGWGGLAVSLLPLLRWTFRLFKTAHASARRR